MIVRIQRGGKSFKWLLTYLTHDAEKAKTSDRVDWTETLNLAQQHLNSAIDEMYWTYRAADQLKRAAGVSTGGTPLKNPVKHVSLNWHPDDKPTKEDMIEAARDFVRYMGWQDHQAVLVAHNDRPHKHVHLMINAVSPIDGRSLSAGYEWNRAERWRENYDRTHFRNRCEQDLKPYAEREKAPTREAWLKFKDAEKEFERAESEHATKTPDYFERHDPGTWKAKEWQALKAHQRAQREKFFKAGKEEFKKLRNAIFREVRTEFRDQWNVWYQLRREGTGFELLGAIKSGILERQNAELEKRRDEACKLLRAGRDASYQDIRREQQLGKAELRARQAEEKRSPDLLNTLYDHAADARQEQGADKRTASDMSRAFRKAEREVFAPAPDTKDAERPESGHQRSRKVPHEHHRVRDPANAVGALGIGAVGALAGVFEKLFDGFLGGATPQSGQKAEPPPSKREARNDNAPHRAEIQQRHAEAQASEADKLFAYWEERRRRRSRDRD